MNFAAARIQADAALAHGGTEPGPPFPPASEYIRAARERLGLGEQDVVRRVGSGAHICPDLELRDDEAFTCAGVHDLLALSKALDTSVSELLLGAAPPDTLVPVACEEVARSLHHQIQQRGMTAEALGEAIGWDIEPVLQEPEALEGYNVAGLRDICSAVGLDWLSIVVHLERVDRRTTG